MIRLKPATLLPAILLPLALFGQFRLTPANGTISGTGHAKSYDFPVVIEDFTITVSPADSVGYRSITVEIPAKAITTENFVRDGYMHISVIRVRKHPDITFVASMAAELAPGSGTVVGNLTFNGVTKEQSVEVTISERDGRLYANGSFVVVPTAFGLPLVVMGSMKVQDHVDLNFEFEIPAP